MSNNPRVKVTLSPNTYLVVKALADAGGTSMSKVIGDLIEAAAPQLTRTFAFLSAAHESDEETRSTLLAALDEMETDLLLSLGPDQAAAHQYAVKSLRQEQAEQPPPKARKARKKA